MLVCTEQQYHASLMRDFPGLVPHSRLGKWLFLAEAGNEEFEQVAERIISAVLRCDSENRGLSNFEEKNSALTKDGNYP
jgi:hypothetical protein